MHEERRSPFNPYHKWNNQSARYRILYFTPNATARKQHILDKLA